MELNQKQLLALVAIGAAFWYFTRKTPATAAQAATTPATTPAPAGGGIWDGFGVGNTGGLGAAMGQTPATADIITNTKAPIQVAAPAPAPAPQTADWSFGGTSAPASSSGGGHLGDDGYYYHADGSRSYVADTLAVQAVWGGTRLA